MRRTVHIPEMGFVSMRKSRRARRISICVERSGEVHVTIPYRGTYRDAELFLHKKSAWIRQHREKARLLREHCRKICAACKTVSRNEAEALLRDRVEQLARTHGFRYGKVSIRRQKTRWGSCSGTNNISLNEKLARLPDQLINFVILHELVHTRVKNHGNDFRRALENCTGDSKLLHRELRHYPLELL